MTKNIIDELEVTLQHNVVSITEQCGVECNIGKKRWAMPDRMFAQFWYRISRARIPFGDLERTVGLLQFSIIEPFGSERSRTKDAANAIAKYFTRQRWTVSPNAHVVTHKMGVALLPRSNVLIVDGSFDYIHPAA